MSNVVKKSTAAVLVAAIVGAITIAPAQANTRVLPTNPGIVVDGQYVGPGETLALEIRLNRDQQFRFYANGNLRAPYTMDCPGDDRWGDVRVAVNPNGVAWIDCR
jgi:hypothetical protein